MSLNLDAYLARLDIEAPSVSVDGLALLQQAQLRAIAFENLDPLTGRVPSLKATDLDAKLVHGGRGGYCFELNGLFGRALEALGFEATPILARVRNGAPAGGMRSHLAFAVRLDGRDWLADVGFGGGGATIPLPLERHRLHYQCGEVYRVVNDPDTGETVLQRLEERDGERIWYSLYGFERGAVPQVDIEAANHLCATWDQAPFSANLMLNRLTPKGRVSAFNTRVNEIRNGVKTTRALRDADELAVLLARDFGLSVEPEALDRIAGKLGLPAGQDHQRSVA